MNVLLNTGIVRSLLDLDTHTFLFQVSSYLSNIGGVLGLWIGFSVMTLTEFLEFFLDVIVLMARERLQNLPEDKA